MQETTETHALPSGHRAGLGPAARRSPWSLARMVLEGYAASMYKKSES